MRRGAAKPKPAPLQWEGREQNSTLVLEITLCSEPHTLVFHFTQSTVLSLTDRPLPESAATRQLGTAHSSPRFKPNCPTERNGAPTVTASGMSCDHSYWSHFRYSGIPWGPTLFCGCCCTLLLHDAGHHCQLVCGQRPHDRSHLPSLCLSHE